jgi:cytochrome c2
MRFRGLHVAVAVAGVAVVVAAARDARADGDADDFKQSCANCHTIGGGPLVGPDLKGVTARVGTPDGPVSRDWLVNFITHPREVLASGDAYATKLKAAARNQEMQQVSGMTPKRAEALLGLIEAESKKEKSVFAQAAGVDLPTDPALLAALVARGRDLFTGATPLAAGGVSCLACHQAGDVGGLGGGRLGPDLMGVVARVGGARAIQAWLAAPPTPTMKPQFGLGERAKPLAGDAEILPLVAFLQDVELRNDAPDRTGQRLVFVFLGVGLAAGALVALDFAWRRRFRGVRAPLVKGQS